MPIVIGIAGPSGTGKTTFAKMIAAELVKFGISVEHINYADPLYAIASAVFGVRACPPTSHEDPERGRRFKDRDHRAGSFGQNLTGREHLVSIGTAVTDLDPLTWTRVLQTRVEASKSDVVIISDVRYPERGEWDIVPPARRYWVFKDAADTAKTFGWCGFTVILRKNAARVAHSLSVSIKEELRPEPTERTCRTCAHHDPSRSLGQVPASCWTCAASDNFGGPSLPSWKEKS